ncbi:MAG: hypothetical protein PHE67_11530 [Campylobacterales bacterium]|nr:hypothetical protein [Campylobacterales bacterium]
MANPFKAGSQPHKLNELFKQGRSLTHDEATQIGVNRLAQRMQDLKKKYIEYVGSSPIMVLDEANERGGTHARYFYRGTGCSHENNPKARLY